MLCLVVSLIMFFQNFQADRLVRKTSKKNKIVLSLRFRTVLREIFAKYTREKDMCMDISSWQKYMLHNKIRQDFGTDIVRFDVFAIHEVKPELCVPIYLNF